jgi:hypothetical protein
MCYRAKLRIFRLFHYLNNTHARQWKYCATEADIVQNIFHWEQRKVYEVTAAVFFNKKQNQTWKTAVKNLL